MSVSEIVLPILSDKKQRWKLAAALAALTAVGLMAHAWLHRELPEDVMVQKISEDSLKLSDEAIKNLKLEKVQRGDFPEKLSLMGKVSVPEDRTAVVPSRVQGRIEAIYVASGEVVVPGQPLCQIFSADFAVAREEFLQTMNQIKENPNDAETKHMLELSKKKLNALGVSAADFQRWGAEGKGETMTVRAPRGGALLGKNAVIGNAVNVGDTLFMIGDLSKVWFAGDVYPEDLRKVHKDQEILIDPENGAPALHGKISFISPAMDPTSRTIKIRALMDNPGNFLRADMYVQGNIIIQNRVGLIAPKNALVRLHDSVFAFKRLPGNIFQRVNVETDGESMNSVSISKGLNDGDDVVSEGALLLDAALNGASS